MFSAATKTGSKAAPAINYIEDVFSTYLYTGTGTTLPVNNGIDLAGKGGLVWLKRRSSAQSNAVFDTVRGENPYLLTDLTDAQYDFNNGVVYNNNGFTLKSNSGFGGSSGGSGQTYCSWTFAEQAKFFDIVTYTGNGVAGRTVAHNLGSVPGMMIIKATNQAYDWQVYHRSLGNTAYAVLNTTAAASTGNIFRWNNTTPTSTVFTLGEGTFVNESGTNYVAYLFAHDAGGFGTTGTDNVISCGSFTTNGSGVATVTLGYEPQYVLAKRTDTAGQGWWIVDNMRGMPVTGNSAYLQAQSSAQEYADGGLIAVPTATGFVATISPSATYIYMAIRRPMKVPTDATTVFSPLTSSSSSGTTLTTGFVVDAQLVKARTVNFSSSFTDRLRGSSSTTTDSGPTLYTASTAAESAGNASQYWSNTGFNIPGLYADTSSVYYSFSRRPGFFDEVCYTGTGTATTQAHNLGVVPEMMIIKKRSGTGDWFVYSSTGIDTGKTYPYPALNRSDDGWFGDSVINATAPTSSVFTINATLNTSTGTYVAYLFATCPGVSKVGSYTGNGTTQAISCGFTGGARFVLIKRTDDVGDWYVYDTARGMTTLTDPYLRLNSTAAETATLGSVTTTAGGFSLNSTILAAINVSGGTYIFLAIA